MMMRRVSFIVLCFGLAIWASLGCGMRQASRKPAPIIIPAGTLVPAMGVGFDAYYDSSLDTVVPGYKILTVAYTNNSMNLVQMNPAHDQWEIIDRRGKKIKAITNLREKDPDLWGELPRKLRVLIEYPLLIPIGEPQTIDLLFKEKVNLSEFRAVIYRPGGGEQVYKIIPREE